MSTITAPTRAKMLLNSGDGFAKTFRDELQKHGYDDRFVETMVGADIISAYRRGKSNIVTTVTTRNRKPVQYYATIYTDYKYGISCPTDDEAEAIMFEMGKAINLAFEIIHERGFDHETL